MVKNNKCECECKKHNICEKDYIWNPATCSCENGKYLASIMDDPAIICDEVVDAEAKSNDEKQKQILMKKQPVNQKISIFCLHFY